MAPVPPDDPKEGSSAITYPPSKSLEAEHKAAVAAYDEKIMFVSPTREKYDTLFIRHQQTRTRFEKIMDKEISHRTTYQRHRRHFSFLSNALLASNATLRSAPKPLSDFQALTHATLYFEVQFASYKLTNMIYQNKRLEKAKDVCWELEKKLFAKCEQFFTMMDRDCREMDRLHAKVLDLEKKMGGKSGCQIADGKCISCARTKEREARAAAAVEQVAREKKGGNGKVSVNDVGKGVGSKGRSEDTVGEWRLRDKANK